MTKSNWQLTNWELDVTEVSAGVYRLVAVHAEGPRIEMTGTDLNKLIEDARDSARKIESEITSRQK